MTNRLLAAEQDANEDQEDFVDSGAGTESQDQDEGSDADGQAQDDQADDQSSDDDSAGTSQTSTGLY